MCRVRMLPHRVAGGLAASMLISGCATNRTETMQPIAAAPTSQPAEIETVAALPSKTQPDSQAESAARPAYVRGTIDDDRAVMRQALQGMERADRDDINTRINLVRELGISGRDGVPQPGELAPDFELAPLRFYDFQVDATPITRENADTLYEPVRLSAFRDKLPVVLIFGSYT